MEAFDESSEQEFDVERQNYSNYGRHEVEEIKETERKYQLRRELFVKLPSTPERLRGKLYIFTRHPLSSKLVRISSI